MPEKAASPAESLAFKRLLTTEGFRLFQSQIRCLPTAELTQLQLVEITSSDNRSVGALPKVVCSGLVAQTTLVSCNFLHAVFKDLITLKQP